MTSEPDNGTSHPCVECGQPSTGNATALEGHDLITIHYCSLHMARRIRAQREAEVRAMSRDLAWTPEEFMGREGHTLMLGGHLVRTMEDPESPPELAAWCARVLEICSDPPLREALQRQYLSPEELQAAAHYLDDF